MTRRLRAIVGVIALFPAALILVSCDECAGVACGACEGPVALTIVDVTTGEQVVDATVDGMACPGICHPTADGPGELVYDVAAPGYAPQTIRVVVAEDDSDGCCGCGWITERVTVELLPGM